MPDNAKSHTLTPAQQGVVKEKLFALGVAQQVLQATIEGIMVGVGLDKSKDWDFNQATMTLTLKEKKED